MLIFYIKNYYSYRALIILYDTEIIIIGKHFKIHSHNTSAPIPFNLLQLAPIASTILTFAIFRINQTACMSFELQFRLPKADSTHQDHQTLGNLIGHSDTLAIVQTSQQFQGLTVVVTPDTRTALRLEKACRASRNCLFSFFLTGKPCLTTISRPIKILFPPVYLHYFSCNKGRSRFSCCQSIPYYKKFVRRVIWRTMYC